MNDEAKASLTIVSLNQRGEGIAQALCGELSVPHALPGEEVRCEIIQTKQKTWGKVLSIEHEHVNRREATCPHFETCGGCTLQHVNDSFYKDFKKQYVARCLLEQGLNDKCLADPIILGPHQRRRIDFMAKKFPDGLSMGFHQVNSRRRVHMTVCPLVVPEIETLFVPLRQLLDVILNLREQVHVFILSAANGVDMLLAGLKRPFDENELKALRNFAEDMGLTRLTYKVKGQKLVVHQSEEPYVVFGKTKIQVAPNVFLQASQKADQILADLVVNNLPSSAKLVVDLFCGRGTLTIPIAESGYQVHGFEGDKHAIAALKAANIDATVRDLFSTPLAPSELEQYQAVVLNPPRTGVKEQIYKIAEAKVPVVIYVSCNPETFSKDMKGLIDHGYTLNQVTPVDQFMWSPHVEVVGVATYTSHPPLG